MNKYTKTLVVVASFILFGCASDVDDNNYIAAGGSSSEDTSEVYQEVSSCGTLQCAGLAVGYKNVCDSNGKTTAFECYYSGSAIPVPLTPTKKCNYCYPYDGVTPWCNGLVTGVPPSPWARCYPSPK